MKRITLPVLLFAMIGPPALAADLSWRDITPKLEGCWSGEGLGGNVSECWIVHEDGRADGMFLMRKDGKPGFAEILTIDDFGDGPQMRLKHVNGDMTGWEEKDDYVGFDFVAAQTNRLAFRGLILSFDGDDSMRAELTMKMSNGDVKVMPFDFSRTASMDR